MLSVMPDFQGRRGVKGKGEGGEKGGGGGLRGYGKGWKEEGRRGKGKELK